MLYCYTIICLVINDIIISIIIYILYIIIDIIEHIKLFIWKMTRTINLYHSQYSIFLTNLPINHISNL